MNIITPPPRAALHPLARIFGLTPADAAPFEGDVRIDHHRGRIFSRHRSGEGHELGWECHQVRPDGRFDVNYAGGHQKGLVVSAALGSRRLRLTEGAVAAIAARALLHPGEPITWIVGLGGVWTADAARHIATLVERKNITIIETANATHHPAGQQMRAAALKELAALAVEVVNLPAPNEGWLAALRSARLGAEVGR
ncbi:hypothetical protein [Falsiroseomonas sp. E2-1-a20]|uniref:hypothetical protein n=1 Tax=Falsiroseomonas sp. E2-1-a20 TaxID=3239300 RepID=UPI003F3549A6